MLFDRTCTGVRRLGLTEWWRLGTNLYAWLGRIDHSFGVTSWSEALDRLLDVSGGARLAEVQYWGHGHWGNAICGEEVLDAGSLAADHAHSARWSAVRERMLRGRDGLFWFRTCETYGTDVGKRFACAFTERLDCRTAGHTYVIHAIQSGLHSLLPGEEPRWSQREGLPPSGIPQEHALPSTWWAPNTISCLQGRIPDGF